MKENHWYKNSVFVDLFSETEGWEENFLSLYNSLNGTHLVLAETTLIPVNLKNTIYIGQYNDVVMLVNDRLVVLVEHQSTINENMPLRFIQYISHTYERLVPQKERYRPNRCYIQIQEVCVIYNGAKDYKKEVTLRL